MVIPNKGLLDGLKQIKNRKEKELSTGPTAWFGQPAEGYKVISKFIFLFG